MARKYFDGNAKMGNNHEQNKDFNRASKEAGLSERERRDFSNLLHDDKEFQTGDRTYKELLDLAKESKEK